MIKAAKFHDDSIVDIKNFLDRKRLFRPGFAGFNIPIGEGLIVNYLNSLKRIKFNIFLSYSPKDYNDNRIQDISEYLTKNKDIKKVIYIKYRNKDKEINEYNEDWIEKKIPSCQMLLFIATENSIKSKCCAYELHIARENKIQIIPIVDNKLDWFRLDEMNEMIFNFSFS